MIDSLGAGQACRLAPSDCGEPDDPRKELSGSSEDSSLSPEGRLLCQLVERSDREERNFNCERMDARLARREALAQQVESMERAADAVETGAWVGAGISAVGGAATLGGGAMKLDSVSAGTSQSEAPRLAAKASIWSEGGTALGRLAQPASQLTGEAPRLRADAAAARAQARATDERDVEESRQRDADALSQHQARLIDLFDRIQASQAEISNAAIRPR